MIFFSAKVVAQSQKGTVINDQVLIYQSDDFDAPVIATLPVGGVYDISNKTKGPFYKIRLKPGTTGWVADTDIQPGVVKEAVRFAQKRKYAEKEYKKPKEKRRRPFDEERHRGLSLDMIQLTEDTMGRTRSENTLFYGLKFAGNNTLMTGEIPIESNLLFHMGAPSYYSRITGNGASGWIFLADFLFQTQAPLSDECYFFYGFGPMARMSHYDLALTSSGRTVGYAADEILLGAVFDLGLAYRFGPVAIRADAKYYWERQKYLGLGASAMLSF